ncbi:hypothetical protein U0035_01700 [Niabella yanshanensis]|uniref:Uncharacterized protein n=1 Tax=Niabella yanshanensis TaxID=577386 RepID=A0ABZ0W6I1_9BACT|nr:hypothetical protein [Niabella yanshanensis]WQD38857.1 hypothetical protein U0035_01700 [Niabella yanshanensis]
MQKKISVLLLLLGAAITSSAQSVVINADGTHSPVIQTGNTVVAINPDGTHSVGMVTGNMITVVDPQGRHSIGFTPANLNSNTTGDSAETYFGQNFHSSSPNFRSRYAEAAPNRFYPLTGKRIIPLQGIQQFRYSFVSQAALRQIMWGSKNALTYLKMEVIKTNR